MCTFQPMSKQRQDEYLQKSMICTTVFQTIHYLTMPWSITFFYSTHCSHVRAISPSSHNLQLWKHQRHAIVCWFIEISNDQLKRKSALVKFVLWKAYTSGGSWLDLKYCFSNFLSSLILVFSALFLVFTFLFSSSTHCSICRCSSSEMGTFEGGAHCGASSAATADATTATGTCSGTAFSFSGSAAVLCSWASRTGLGRDKT